MAVMSGRAWMCRLDPHTLRASTRRRRALSRVSSWCALACEILLRRRRQCTPLCRTLRPRRPLRPRHDGPPPSRSSACRMAPTQPVGGETPEARTQALQPVRGPMKEWANPGEPEGCCDGWLSPARIDTNSQTLQHNGGECGPVKGCQPDGRSAMPPSRDSWDRRYSVRSNASGPAAHQASCRPFSE